MLAILEESINISFDTIDIELLLIKKEIPFNSQQKKIKEKYYGVRLFFSFHFWHFGGFQAAFVVVHNDWYNNPTNWEANK